MSPTTGNLSPQFYVVFNNEFSTLPFLRQQQQPPHWSQLLNQFWYLATDQNFELSNTWETIPSPDEHVPRILPSKGDFSAQQEDSWQSEGGELAPTRTAEIPDNPVPCSIASTKNQGLAMPYFE